jgi:hypothetical protein
VKPDGQPAENSILHLPGDVEKYTESAYAKNKNMIFMFDNTALASRSEFPILHQLNT